MARFVVPAALAALAILVALAGAAEEKALDPEYVTWSKFPKGTKLVTRTVTTVDGITIDTTTETTLLEVTSGKVVLESAGTLKVGGMESKVPAAKREVQRLNAPPTDWKIDDWK